MCICVGISLVVVAYFSFSSLKTTNNIIDGGPLGSDLVVGCGGGFMFRLLPGWPLIAWRHDHKQSSKAQILATDKDMVSHPKAENRCSKTSKDRKLGWLDIGGHGEAARPTEVTSNWKHRAQTLVCPRAGQVRVRGALTDPKREADCSECLLTGVWV